MVFLRIAMIMLAAMFLSSWLLHLAGLWIADKAAPHKPKAPRKRPIDQGPETRLADRLPIRAARRR